MPATTSPIPVRQRLLIGISLVGIGLAAAAAQIYATSLGIGTTADSRFYLEAARRLYSTHSYSVTSAGVPAPLVHFPPFLPVVLSASGFLSIDALDAARWINASLLLAAVVATGALIHRLSPRSRVMPIAGALLVVSHYAILMNYLWLWSEPLFICLLLAGFLALSYGQTFWPLALAGLFIGLAWLTRYVGGVFVASLGLWLLLLPGSARARLGRAGLFVAIGSLPMALWSLRNILVTGRPVNRVINFQPFSPVLLAEFRTSGFALDCVVLAMAVFLIWGLQGNFAAISASVKRSPVIAALWLSIPVYLAGLLASILFADPTTPLDDRILAPVLVLLIVAAISTLSFVQPPAAGSQRFRITLLVCCCAYLLFFLHATWGNVAQFHQKGGTFTGQAWRSSPTMAYIRALPADAPIYSNAEDAIYVLTGRLTHVLPYKPDGRSQTVAAYNQAVDAMRQDVLQNHGVVISFSSLARTYQPGRAEIHALLPNLPVSTFADGSVVHN